MILVAQICKIKQCEAGTALQESKYRWSILALKMSNQTTKVACIKVDQYWQAPIGLLVFWGMERISLEFEDSNLAQLQLLSAFWKVIFLDTLDTSCSSPLSKLNMTWKKRPPRRPSFSCW